MSPERKPEWFQIADADNAASTRTISKGLPIMAILAFAAIIGVGTVVAQTQDEAPANATETVAPALAKSNLSSTDSETTALTAQVSTLNKSESPTVSTIDSTVAPQTPSTPGIANPLGKNPSSGEHEDGENDEEGEDD
jgi:hypothetical protein